MKRTLADLFVVPPLSWGARGDPYLWEDLRMHFINDNTPLPDSLESLGLELLAAFEVFTAHSINERDWFHLDKYAHGGMSSGHMDPVDWREGGKTFEYIQQNLIQAARADEISGH
jgi:hypothetical protein